MNKGSQHHECPLENATIAYREAFGESPQTSAVAPGRVNLIGDHTDYHNGVAMPVALRQHAAVMVGQGVTGRIEIVAPDLNQRFEAAFEPDQILHASTPHWSAYPGGIACLMQKKGFANTPAGIRLSISSSIPIGGGLSGSAAIEVATAIALGSFWQAELDPIETAMLCQQTEHQFAHTPSGLLDPLASLLSTAGHATLLDFETLKHESIPIPLGAVFVLIDTGLSHNNADGRYAEVRALGSSAAKKMGVATLRSITPQALHAQAESLTRDQFQTVEHVVSENERVREFARAIRNHDLVRGGVLMRESHRSLSQRLGVSTPQIDHMIDALDRVGGVLGCRLTGGGFGGFLVALIRPDGAQRVMTEIDRVVTPHGGSLPHDPIVTPSEGARAVPVPEA